MATSRVMTASSSSSPSPAPAAVADLARQSSIYSIIDPSRNLGSMSMDDLLRNIYADAASPLPSAAGDPPASVTLHRDVGSRTVEDVWREISGGGGQGPSASAAATAAATAAGEMTLEDFLARAGAVREEDVRGIFAAADQAEMFEEGGGGGGNGRKRAAGETVVDKVVMQRQKRMIKNRESAARSRERKQAYTVELEGLASQLEDENLQLRKYQEEQESKRLDLLKERVIPVTQKKRPHKLLRRTRSL